MTREIAWPQISQPITQDVIDAYAELSGDYNPLHVDPVRAAASELGGIVAHGPIALQPFFCSLTAWLDGDPVPAGTVTRVRFLRPSRPGDTITALLRDVEGDGSGALELHVECVNQDGDAVAAVHATLPGVRAD